MDQSDRDRIMAEARAILDGSWTLERFPRRAKPQPGPSIEKSEAADGLVYGASENAMTPAGEPAAMQQQLSDDWNAWLDQRLEQERQLTVDLLGEVIAQLRHEQRNTDHDAWITSEFVKVWQSITQATKAIVDIQHDRVAQSFREVGADSAKKMN